ncbi:UV-endonuclease UvdE-domain-containing protein [Lentinula lateritia]|nr:UV-endonuclease UvdE-domain-containing protein [Lentinula lateritia]
MNSLQETSSAVSSQRRSARIRTIANNNGPSVVSAAIIANDNVNAIGTKRKRTSDKVSVEIDNAGLSSELSAIEDESIPKTPKKKRKKKKAGKESQRVSETVKVDADEEAYDEVKVKKARRPRKPKPEPVYIIHIIQDVERRETKFRGRLGTLCLPQYNFEKQKTCFRRCVLLQNLPVGLPPFTEEQIFNTLKRIDSIKKNGLDWVKELGRKNVQDLITMIQWNEDNNIRFLRLSSEMFPFASHPIYGYSLEYCSSLLAEAGALAKKYGHRLTTHPGQFTQLGSPKPGVIESSIRELEYHCQMLDLMGVGKDGVTIVHGGGVYDDKPGTIERIKTTIRDILPQHVRDRLVLENDELCYNADDLLPICEELDVPLVFDYHHDALKPSSIPPAAIIKRTNAIFARRGIRPKQHLSDPRPGAVTLMERRAHADRCERLPDELELEGIGIDVDLMIEAKDKEQAVLQLYRIYGLEEVKYESLRPPNENQTKETKGRKSNKKAKKGEQAMIDGVEGEGEDLVNVDEDNVEDKLGDIVYA